MVNANEVELLAPAGNFRTALAAFGAGADAVYCGLADFSARAFADNFSFDDLKNLIRFAHAPQPAFNPPTLQPFNPPTLQPSPRKVYVTFNTLVDEGDVESAVEELAKLDELRPDALIVQDLGVARLCRTYFPGLALHASTQLVAHNLEGVLALRDLGFTRVVLARELSLEEIASIAKRCGVELECFIHGALCYSLSGLCLFGAMEKDRSGNRGKCPYCCRQEMEVQGRGAAYPFSMKDLRLGEDVRRLADAGVASLKIEGRMKSELYVASVTKYYRQILSGGRGPTVSDLETVFSRRTTRLYFDGAPTPNPSTFQPFNPSPLQPFNLSTLQPSNPSTLHPDTSPIDSESLGHLGTPIGTVKRITKDREGLSWLRFHTARGLEKHDGLQFEAMADGKHVGMGVVEMRQAISRRPVFEVNAGVDVEVQLSEETAAQLRPGMKIYCSMSNAVKRMFPQPGFRPSDYPGDTALELEVALAPDAVSVRCPDGTSAAIACALQPAKSPDRTFAAVEKAFSKLGETDYRIGSLRVSDPDRLFAPMSVLNDLRRDLVERLDEAREKARREKIARALADEETVPESGVWTGSTVKLRPDQKLPDGAWDEVIVAIDAPVDRGRLDELAARFPDRLRLALPVYTKEPDFNRLRVTVKGLLRAGFTRWEASDLATLRMLRALDVGDITADWTLYAFNLSALRRLSTLGVRRFVASPENGRENLQFLAESGFAVEFLAQQATPLFVSLTEPAAKPAHLAVFRRNGLWVTTKPVPRTFAVPEGAPRRLDLSWDPEDSCFPA